MSSILSQITGSGTLNSYSPRLDLGTHTIAVFSTELKEVYDKQINGKVAMVAMEAVVIESTVHTAGDRRADAWMVGKAGTPGEANRKRCNAFARALAESIGGNASDDVEVAETLGKTLELDEKSGGWSKGAGRRFPGRGVLLRVTTSSRKGKDGKDYVNNDYSVIKQTADQITAMRAKLEAQPVKSAASAPAAATAPAPSMLDGI